MIRTFRMALTALLVGVGSVSAQERPGMIGARLLQDERVQRVLEAARRRETETLQEQVRICEIPAPPFGEAQRGAYVKTRFEDTGLANVRTDAVGNVIGELPGRAARPNLVLSAHLDTVFPEGTDVTVSRDGAVLKAPGIGDDCRGLAVLLAVATLLRQAGIETPGTITFVATVGEEGLGDLRGVKHLFGQELKGRIDRFVSVDGAGGAEITNVAVGSRRYRITFEGPGGHSYGAFGLASPINALGRAIAAFADTVVPRQPKTTFNVGRVGGGTSVNSIAFDAWMEVDMRSSDPAALKDLEVRFLLAVDDAIAAEHERWGATEPLTVRKDLVGHRPPGSTPADSPIVMAAQSVARALGLSSRLTEGSTDSNVPIDLGIPAITVDAGGHGKGSHSLDETFDSTDSWKGTQWVVLIALALAQP